MDRANRVEPVTVRPTGRPGVLSPRPRVVAPRPVAELAHRVGADPAASHGGRAVTGVTLDSRAVRPGDLYAALPGARFHGADFAADAAGLGAVALLTDADGARRSGDLADLADLAVVVVPDPRAVLGDVSAWVYGTQDGRPAVIGVTGTNGKTTTAYLVEAGLAGTGRTTGLVGTIETRVGDERLGSVRTTPEAPDLHALLAVMRERGVEVCAMEVSSHALSLHRADGVVADVAVFTNLSQDHLDFHPDLEHYYAAKASLFTPARARRAVVCVDDDWGRRLAAEATVPVTTVTTGDGPADWTASRVGPDAGGGMRFVLTGPDGVAHGAASPLPGRFNVANTALAVVALVELSRGRQPTDPESTGGPGADVDALARAVAASPGVPGRMERVAGPAGDGPLAVVDYAHSPDAVAAALAALRPQTAGRLVVVLGAGGDRDAGKRGPMGAAAARHADVVVVTDDNPRSEDPATVRAAVRAGAESYSAAAGHAPVVVTEVAGRRAAVLAAVRAAPSSADTVLLAGKGHEQGQEVAGTVHPFDDREVLREALAQVAADRDGGVRT